MEGFLGYFSGGMSDGFLWRHLKYRIFLGGGLDLIPHIDF